MNRNSQEMRSLKSLVLLNKIIKLFLKGTSASEYFFIFMLENFVGIGLKYIITRGICIFGHVCTPEMGAIYCFSQVGR